MFHTDFYLLYLYLYLYTQVHLYSNLWWWTVFGRVVRWLECLQIFPFRFCSFVSRSCVLCVLSYSLIVYCVLCGLCAFVPVRRLCPPHTNHHTVSPACLSPCLLKKSRGQPVTLLTSQDTQDTETQDLTYRY